MPPTSLTLRPVRPSDYDFLFSLLVDGGNGARWRFRGATPSPEGFERALWAGVAAQLVAESRGRPLGLGMIFNAVLEAGHAEIGIALDERVQGRGVAAVATGLGILRYAFLTWPLNKVYARVPGFNMKELGSLERFGWVEEGRLREFCFANGRYWDEHVFALSRPAWDKLDQRLGRFCPPLGVARLGGGR